MRGGVSLEGLAPLRAHHARAVPLEVVDGGLCGPLRLIGDTDGRGQLLTGQGGDSVGGRPLGAGRGCAAAAASLERRWCQSWGLLGSSVAPALWSGVVSGDGGKRRRRRPIRGTRQLEHVAGRPHVHGSQVARVRQVRNRRRLVHPCQRRAFGGVWRRGRRHASQCNRGRPTGTSSTGPPQDLHPPPAGRTSSAATCPGTCAKSEPSRSISRDSHRSIAATVASGNRVDAHRSNAPTRPRPGRGCPRRPGPGRARRACAGAARPGSPGRWRTLTRCRRRRPGRGLPSRCRRRCEAASHAANVGRGRMVRTSIAATRAAALARPWACRSTRHAGQRAGRAVASPPQLWHVMRHRRAPAPCR